MSGDCGLLAERNAGTRTHYTVALARCILHAGMPKTGDSAADYKKSDDAPPPRLGYPAAA